MRNYEYIVSSLPVLLRDSSQSQAVDTDAILCEIREQCSSSDCKAIDRLLAGFEPENLTEEMYRDALGSDDAFIRSYFSFDLNVRNAKAEYLNQAFGLPEGQDTISVKGCSPLDDEEALAVHAILHQDDILKRERGLDGLYWDKIDELTLFNYFDLDAILGFIAKLKITDRWLRLDEQTGREMFRTLVSQVRSTFKGVEYSE